MHNEIGSFPKLSVQMDIFLNQVLQLQHLTRSNAGAAVYIWGFPTQILWSKTVKEWIVCITSMQRNVSRSFLDYVGLYM